MKSVRATVISHLFQRISFDYYCSVVCWKLVTAMQKLYSTCEGEKDRLLTGDRLGVELLTSANMKDLESPVAKGLAWRRFVRRMTSGTVLCLAEGGGRGLSRPSEPSLNLRLLGSLAGLFTLPSLCWGCRALPVCCWLGEKSASSKSSKLLRSHHAEESWNNVGGAELWDKCVHDVCHYLKHSTEKEMLNAKKTPAWPPCLTSGATAPGLTLVLIHCPGGLPCCLWAGPTWVTQGPPGTLVFACNPKQKETLF